MDSLDLLTAAVPILKDKLRIINENRQRLQELAPDSPEINEAALEVLTNSINGLDALIKAARRDPVKVPINEETFQAELEQLMKMSYALGQANGRLIARISVAETAKALAKASK